MYSVTRIRIDIQVCAAGTRRNSGPKAYEKPMFRHQQVHINIPKMPKPKVLRGACTRSPCRIPDSTLSSCGLKYL